MPHIPVLLTEAIDFIFNLPDGLYLDATAGQAGHSKEIIRRLNPKGRLISIDLDPLAVQELIQISADYSNWTIMQKNFAHIKELLQHTHQQKFDGIIADLGISSAALDNPQTGLSFQSDGPLDSRFDRIGNPLTAQMLLNQSSEKELAQILVEYGEVPYAAKIARAIKIHKPQSTLQLAQIVEQSAQTKNKQKLLAQVFQALRIKVNRELDNLTDFLQALPLCLNSGGRAAVIAYHSLEARLVKDFFYRESQTCVCPPEYPLCLCHHLPSFKLLTKRAVTPSKAEIETNPRSRSAKLRSVERL